ncbi:MAG: YfdX family protein [Pseudomonadota bacterium]|nr:YfdX family protein [Pseudomonadota bacterium]
MSLSRKAMLACILGCLALLPSAVFADIKAKPDPQTQNQTQEKRKALLADATSAIQETQLALKYLDEGKKKQALAALERATGKLDIILARDPALTLAPAAVNVLTVDLQASTDAVKALRKQIQDLMDAGRLQEARRLLGGLASETVVSVSNIPLATYPVAIKDAAKLIDENKTNEAKSALQNALNTQVVTDTIIPLPVANAQTSLKEAETLAEKKDRTSEDNNRLKASLENTRSQLERAQALGYGKKSDFDTFYQQLKEIEQKTADNKYGTGFFAKIKASITDLMKSSQAHKP